MFKKNFKSFNDLHVTVSTVVVWQQYRTCVTTFEAAECYLSFFQG